MSYMGHKVYSTISNSCKLQTEVLEMLLLRVSDQLSTDTNNQTLFLALRRVSVLLCTTAIGLKHNIKLKAQLHGSQFWRQFFLKSASRFQYSNLIGCVHANYDVIVNISGVRYLENRRTRFRATAPLI